MGLPADRKQNRRGFTLIETTMALLIVGAMILVFGAVFPNALATAKMGNTYAQATGLAQHKVEQLRAAGYAALVTPSKLVQLNITDAGATGTTLPYSVPFTAVDHLTGGSPGVSLLPPGSTGTIAVTDYSTINPSVPTGTVASVTVTISWQGGGFAAGQYQTSALIIQMPHA